MDLAILTTATAKSLRWLISGMMLVLLVCAASPAQAFPLSRFTEFISYPEGHLFGRDEHAPEAIFINGPGYFVKAETSGNGVVLPLGMGGASAEAVVDGDGGIASALVTHYFGVVGPVIPDPIPVLVEAKLAVEVERGARVITDLAQINVWAPGVIDKTVSANGCRTLPPPAPPDTILCEDRTVDWVFDLGMPLGLDGAIGLVAMVGGHGGRIRAVADPWIHIDPSFPLADQYQVILSSNVSNIPPQRNGGGPLPLSSTASLLLAGMIALALSARRQRKREVQSRAA